MAWEWSHTVKAYWNARENLAELSKEELEIIYAEWSEWEDSFNERKYGIALKHASKLCHDFLVAWIWERAEQFRTCDNGGFNAWICPYGCHAVPFSREESEK